MNGMDAELIEKRFSATEPSRRRLHVVHAVVLAMLAGLIVQQMFGRQWGVPAEAGALLLMGVFAVAMLSGSRAGRRQRRCRGLVVEAWEHVQLDRWDPAEATLAEVMQTPIPSSSDRGQAFMLLATLAEHQDRYECAAQIYETLLLRRIGDAMHLQQAQIALAAAKLRNEELTDAVNLLGRLEQISMPQGMRAALDIVRLYQQVFMGHCSDAVEACDERRALYGRHLSTNAGYGYGLLAAAMHNLGRPDEAARLWSDATTLIKADKLVMQYPLLAPVSGAYPATEHLV